jgi:FkbM family methyltransferase
MSEINKQWLAENFPKNCNIFDIGCADMGDTMRFKELMPNNRFYAFECSQAWLTNNLRYAKEYGINYFHIAMSDHCNGVQFYPSENWKGKDWNWSGTTFKPGIQEGMQWGEPYSVESTTLNEFCKTHCVVPDFIHIDVEAGEYAVLNNMEPTFRPKAIWAEICILSLHDSKVDYHKFNDMMLGQGYTQVYISGQDALYVRNDVNLTSYPEESNSEYLNN